MRLSTSAVGVALIALAGCQTIAPAENAAVKTVSTAEVSAADPARQVFVKTQAEFKTAIKLAEPGDQIVLANGTWADFDMVVEATGTAEAPIRVTSEAPGSVVLTGQSSLRLGGEHIIVSGLVFRDGFTPRNEVISFRRDSKTLAMNSRVTNTVIENYSNPDRTQRDMWVVMYGQNNRFDHNHLVGKLNAGPTMAVRLNTEDSQNNNHRIDHNYFGPRPVFGSNGGETLRIGTSQYSLSNSNTIVENNFFDRCSGEVEIVSNKSGGNTYRGNTFFESRGTLTLRHGNETLVENNLFDGNGALYSGGVRVINARQTIRNNYFKDLTGERFSGALVVMNGVPNSPINRYHQVDEVLIEDNTFLNPTAIELGEGSDKERSAVPVNSAFRNNLIVSEDGSNPFNIYDDLSGVDFVGNTVTQPVPDAISAGFTFENSPVFDRDTSAYGVERSKTGVDWYPKPSHDSPFSGGKIIAVAPGENAISSAVRTAEQGDRLVLAAGDYNESIIINLQIPITIEADFGATPRITFERKNLFLLSSNGALRLKGVSVSGEKAPDGVGNSFISTTSRGGGGNHVLEIVDSQFENFTVNRSFSVVEATKGTFYDKIHVTGSSFANTSGSVFKLDSETDDFGIYNAEFLTVENSAFANIAKPVASVYRGGRDESTFGPHVTFLNSTFANIGSADTPLMLLHGVQHVRIEGNAVSGAAPIRFVITTGKPKPILSGNQISGAERPVILVTTDMR